MSSFRLILLIGFLSLSIQSCKPKEQVVVEPEIPKPSWVTGRPINPAYYIGVGMAPKRFHPNDFAEKAKQNALNDMASEIQVKVQSNSMLFSFEDQAGFRDDYKDFIQVKTNSDLRNYELMDSFENGDEYWVYYRLSKATYEADLKQRTEKAMNRALLFIEQGESFEAKGEHKNAFTSYFNALEPLKPFLGQDLRTLYHEEEVYVGNMLFHKVDDLTKSLVLSIPTNPMEAVLGDEPNSGELTFTLKDRAGEPVSGYPVVFDYSEGLPADRRGITDANGEVRSGIDKLKSTKPNQWFTAKVDYPKLINEDALDDELMDKILEMLPAIETEVNLVVKQPIVSFQGHLKAEGTAVNRPEIQNVVLSELNRKGMMTSMGLQSDLEVHVYADTRPAGMQQDVHSVFLSGRMEVVRSSTGKTIYTDDFRDFKGVQLSEAKAVENAYAKLSAYLKDTGIPRFYRFYLR